MSNKYLDKDGLIELWAKIKNNFATKESVRTSISTSINEIVDNAPNNLNTFKKVADKLDAQQNLITQQYTAQSQEMDNKQDKLIAGSHITIEDNVISVVNADPAASWGRLGSE